MFRIPKVVGYVDIPLHLKDYGSSLPRQLVREVITEKALLLELDTPEDADHYQHSIINAGVKEFGQGHIQTATEENKLYVWRREGEPDPLGELKRMKAALEIEGPYQCSGWDHLPW